MAGNWSPSTSTPGAVGFPIHKLREKEYMLWMLAPATRRRMAQKLADKYGCGVGVLNHVQELFAYVERNGVIQEATPPFRRFPNYMIANRPTARDCACMRFYDEESMGPWGMRADIERVGHHPLCEFDHRSLKTFDITHQSAKQRVAEKKTPYARPDEIRKVREGL